MSADRLPRAYQSIIAAFAEAGGHGTLDMHGRITVGPTKHPMQGDTVTWLQLVARGLVAGEEGRLLLTDLGREEAAAILKGRTREAIGG